MTLVACEMVGVFGVPDEDYRTAQSIARMLEPSSLYEYNKVLSKSVHSYFTMA